MALWKEIENSVGKWIENADQWMRDNNMPDIYVSYNSKSGLNANINTNNNIGGIPQKPQAYQANAAKTASSIKQGGMTKDEVQEFNMKHQNETAIRGNE